MVHNASSSVQSLSHVRLFVTPGITADGKLQCQLQNEKEMEVSWCLVVQIQGFPYCGPGSVPGWGTEIPQVMMLKPK